jgi:hypothetical protein
MNKNFIFLSVLLLLISGCTTSSGNSISSIFNFGKSGDLQGGSNKPTSGNGLEVRLTIDDDLIPRLRYDLELRNTGDMTIEIDREQFSFLTEQTVNGQSIITSESLDLFYENIFRNNNVLQIPPSGEWNVYSGILSINSDFYKEISNDRLDYLLKITYDYITTFNNNIELDLERFIIKSDRPSQAAPVKMTKIDITPTQDNSIFQVIYTIEDTSTSLEETTVEINDIEIIFGSQNVNCRYFYDEDSEFIQTDDPILSKIYDSLLLVCDISVFDFEEFGITNTKTSGSFSYSYIEKERGIIRFPEDSRSLGIN